MATWYSKPPRNWTPDMVNYLRAHHAEQNVSELADNISAIARQAGARYVNERAIYGQLRRQGLKCKPKKEIRNASQIQ